MELRHKRHPLTSRMASAYDKRIDNSRSILILRCPQVVRSRWQTPAASPTPVVPETVRWRRWRLPVAWRAQPRPSGAPWRSRSPSAYIIPASPRTVRPCPGTARRRKCVYRHTRRKFSDALAGTLLARIRYVTVVGRARRCRWLHRRSSSSRRRSWRSHRQEIEGDDDDDGTPKRQGSLYEVVSTWHVYVPLMVGGLRYYLALIWREQRRTIEVRRLRCNGNQRFEDISTMLFVNYVTGPLMSSRRREVVRELGSIVSRWWNRVSTGSKRKSRRNSPKLPDFSISNEFISNTRPMTYTSVKR